MNRISFLVAYREIKNRFSLIQTNDEQTKFGMVHNIVHNSYSTPNDWFNPKIKPSFSIGMWRGPFQWPKKVYVSLSWLNNWKMTKRMQFHLCVCFFLRHSNDEIIKIELSHSEQFNNWMAKWSLSNGYWLLLCSVRLWTAECKPMQ